MSWWSGIHETEHKWKPNEVNGNLGTISFYFYENAQHISISKFYGTIKRTQIIVLILLRLNSSESK